MKKLICTCGCRRPVQVKDGRGRPSEYYSSACRKRAQRARQINNIVTSSSSDVTKIMNTIVTGDSRELAKLISDESIDMIFTGPPYDKKSLPLYSWLAEEAARVLKPGGFLLVYTGGFYKDKIMQMLGGKLKYYWDFIEVNRGNNPCRSQRMIGHKSILAFTNGKPRKFDGAVFDTWQGSDEDNRYHTWGQAESTARYYVNQLSRPGELIWEPFTGGGTVPYVCKQIGRDFIAFEIDPSSAGDALERIGIVQALIDASI